jgi:hypothetical protein
MLPFKKIVAPTDFSEHFFEGVRSAGGWEPTKPWSREKSRRMALELNRDQMGIHLPGREKGRNRSHGKSKGGAYA